MSSTIGGMDSGRWIHDFSGLLFFFKMELEGHFLNGVFFLGSGGGG